MRRWLAAPHVQAAVRVAAVTTLVGLVIYAAVCAGLVIGARASALQTVDRELHQHLQRATVTPPFGSPDEDGHRALYGPSYLWRVGADGSVAGASSDAPALPPSLRHVGGPATVDLEGAAYRLAGAPSGSGWIVLGVSLAFVDQTQNALVADAALGLVPVMLVVFASALVIGLRSSQPIEHARRQLLAFTGDASHELRTPLQLIEAELSVALRRDRDAAEYRRSLERIANETGHMHRLVDDLLWLARFDSRAGEQAPGPVDLVAAASGAVARFGSVAAQRGLDLALEVPDGEPPMVMAPPAWIDRLLGVLIDNACRYTPGGGAVLVAVEAQEGLVSLTVEDSGPGVPLEERSRIFERFHRAANVPGGAGLGLAIADAIVRSSGGRWHVDTAGSGGAEFTVSWPPARRRPTPIR